MNTESLDLIAQTFAEGASLRQLCSDQLTTPLLKANDIVCECLQSGGKVLACGNGGSAADAQHFAGELVNRFTFDRPACAAIALTHDASVITSIANDMGFEHVFSRQVEALGRAGDVLLVISTSGNSANILAAVDVAAKLGIRVIALTGSDGGRLQAHEAVDVNLHVPHSSTPRVQEIHITCLHILCDLLDRSLFAQQTGTRVKTETA